MPNAWEIDFYSRPITDERQKKLWELLVCDPQRRFEFTKYCVGAEANARWLQTALTEALEFWRSQLGTEQETTVPERIRFFRRPMANIITRACDALTIPAQPSRRTFALYQWLQERHEQVYPQHPGFQPLLAPPPTFEPTPMQPLPDALVGQGWRVVTLQAQDFAESQDWEIAFGDPLIWNLASLPPDRVIPGVLIVSPRAVPLAGWLSGLELACLSLVRDPQASLVLEAGLSDRWLLAPLKTAQTIAEIESFEKAKQAAGKVHFLAVQTDANADSFAGFWILQEPSLEW
ncbi:DUF1092 family protein [Synechococcales cyanobacterium C]|uniref:DUF1092 family protein n=1 Tax=Petrachloros mirabilis ULC683 TaxID=2781853 RepID=A0A8K2A973_9CYAN|nr:Tab2/Atab2 family RNA-binding protein [Petrachloros mirabilis]NCJ07855.1 DUF1092 family protein [Petrachloros mirabilis ULC683]